MYICSIIKQNDIKVKYSIEKGNRFKKHFSWLAFEDSDGIFVTIEYIFKNGIESTCSGLETNSLRGARRVARRFKNIPKGTKIILHSAIRGSITLTTY